MPINPTRLMMEQQQLGAEMTTKEALRCPKSHEEALSFIEEMTSKCDQVQKKVIGEIMRQNGETEYLKRYGVDKLTDRAGFKSRVPVVSYEDIQADIQRIANGDFSSILSGEPISEFLTSSGTSGGERKLMPTIKEETDRRQLLYSLLMPVMNKFVPDLDKGKALYFYFIKAETRTPGGLLARPVLTSYYKSSHFRNRPHDPYTVITSPNETILCNDSFQSMYAQMLCGLYNRHSVLRVGAVFASGLLRAIRFLLTHYSDLSRDISTGKPGIIITDPLVREAVSRVMMKPDPELARFVMEECVKGEEGIVKRIWPNTKYLDVIVTGAMAQYIPTLDYYSGGLPKASTMYASSECYFGLNLRPMCDPSEVSYTIMPNMAYFEFIPLPLHEDDDNHSLSSSSSSSDAAKPQGPQPNLVELADVEVGKQYELVITTYAGLYRYRVGDVLLVTSFHNSAPQFRFIRRKNVLLSIDSDKTDESELQQAVQRASQILQSESHASVAEYTSYADTKTIPGHYVIYWELIITTTHGDGKPTYPTQETLRKCCLEMEEGLNAVYRQCRVADGSLGPLEIRVVKEGTFEELMDYAISRGASINQYKVPRCVNFSPILELLDARVVSSHVSPSLPRWTPGGGQRRENISRD